MVKMLQLRSVLVASDLSPSSAAVLRGAAAVAKHSCADLHVLHVLEMSILPFAVADSDMGAIQSPITEIGRKLEEHVDAVLPAGANVASCRLVIGSPGQTILDRAHQVGAGLIVLGPHRPRSVADPVLGSTADRVVRTTEVPCLVVRGAMELPLRRVLVPLDLSRPARGALREAMEWSRTFCPARVNGSSSPVQLSVLHVIPHMYEMYDFPFDQAVIGPELHKEVEAVVGSTVGEGIELREDLVWGDDPAEAILRAAREWPANLIVLGTHARGGLVRALIGSVSSHVARAAPCAVLLVPPALWPIEARDGVAGTGASAIQR
jgi:universal stress protein E